MYCIIKNLGFNCLERSWRSFSPFQISSYRSVYLFIFSDRILIYPRIAWKPGCSVSVIESWRDGTCVTTLCSLFDLFMKTFFVPFFVFWKHLLSTEISILSSGKVTCLVTRRGNSSYSWGSCSTLSKPVIGCNRIQ